MKKKETPPKKCNLSQKMGCQGMGGVSSFEGGIDLVLAELRSVLIRKQRQYGHGNIMAFGKMGVMVRMSDKMERIKNLWKNGRKPEDEAVYDSYLDIANYAIIWLMLEKGIFELPVKEKFK